MDDRRAYVSSHFALEMDAASGPKEMIGFLRSLEGGAMKADVQSWKSGNIPDVWKQLGRPKFDDLSLQVSMSLSKRFYTWIEQFFSRQSERRTGASIGADFNYVERTRRNWVDGLISEVTIPALDAASKEAAHMTVKITPEQMSEEKGSGKRINAKEHDAHKRWHSANFRFT